MTKKNKRLKTNLCRQKKTKTVADSREQSSQQGILRQALAFHQSGRLAQAETLYRQVLLAEPNHPEALHFLGVLAYQERKYEIAVELISQAIRCRPDYIDAHVNLGVTLKDRGKLDEAVASFRRALTLKHDHVDAHYNLGVTLKAQGRTDEAAASFRRALVLKPDYVDAWTNLGGILNDRGELDEAVASFRRALALKPDFAEAQNNLGNVLKAQGKLDEALASLRRALSLKPDYAEAYNNLGNVLKEQGKPDEAIAAYQRALILKPDYPGAYYNLGNTLMEQGKLDEAIASFRRALSLNRNYVEAQCNLGNALKDQYKLDEAVASFRRALTLKPDYAIAHYNLGNTLKDQGKLDEALTSYRRALSLQPDFGKARSNLLYCLNYLPHVTQKKIYEESLQWDEQLAGILPEQDFAYPNSKVVERKLRIGYVSADFKKHSVASFIEPVLVSHDREQVEVFCYANVMKPDSMTRRLQAEADHWHSIAGKSDLEVVELIKGDKIDILVDLGGHTGESRLLVFAYKPSPVQVTWLGYPNTTGLRTMDYRLTDAIVDPPGEADFFHSEKLIRLEYGFLCYQADESAPETDSPPCLERGHVTFGSFNNLAKLNPEVIKVWAEILRGQPRSRLMLKAQALTDEGNRKRFLRMFAEHGIAADRLDLHGWMPVQKDHLELYREIDIGLDPFPYNGTTTTCEALWLGVPVVAGLGDRHAARVGASIMHQVGIEELVAKSMEEYVGLAVGLANDLDRLTVYRNSLRDRMRQSKLMDQKLFTTVLEKAYRQIWGQWCQE